MRRFITIGLAAITLAASAGVGAAVAQPYGYGQYNERQDRDRDRDGIRDRHDRYDNRYGRWDNRWGRHPAPPPRHWRNERSWYGHVRACQMRYRSYNPARDMYFTGRVWVRCRL